MSTETATEQVGDARRAWAAYVPDTQHPWGLEQAGHLYRRAAFGGNWDELRLALEDGPELTVEKLLKPNQGTAEFNQLYDGYETAAARSGAISLQSWWLRRMLETPQPLAEQLTLFWHNFFGVTNARVNNPALMCRFLHTLRANALGDLETLFRAVFKEPAFYISLDARANRKARPNLKLAQIVLGQFTLGEGHFTQEDALSTARAFSGWFVTEGQFHFVEHEHDTGPKRLLGREGDFSVDELVAALVRQRPTSELLVRRLYRWFISETAPADDQLVSALAADFSQDHDLSRLIGTMLRSNVFFSPVAYRQKIKSPVEFAVGLLRSLQGSAGTVRLAEAMGGLGQDLFEPPTVKGWAGSRYWLNTFAVLGRAELGRDLLSSSSPYEAKLDPGALARKHGCDTADTAARFLCDLLVQNQLSEPLRNELRKKSGGDADNLRRLAMLVTTLPEYQLA